MRISSCWLQRQVAKSLAVLLLVPLAQASTAPRLPHEGSGQAAAQAQQQQQPAANSGSSTTEPALPSEPQNHSLQQGSSQATSPQAAPAQQTNAQEPVGTAAAPSEKPVGAAVSRPAGAAIAPAKQKRRRTFLIRVGLVVGAAIAVGTVVALSKASRSRP